MSCWISIKQTGVGSSELEEIKLLQKKVQEAAVSSVPSTKAVGHLAEAGERTRSNDVKTETEKVMSQFRNECRLTGQGQRGRM